jgi:isoquinoline 1-oxidoreductase beta subunit
VRQVIVLDDLVAVIGDHMWAAKQGLAALDITWNDGPNGNVSTDLIWSRLREASKRDGAVAKEVGSVGEVFGKGGVVTAEYEMPLLAHATLEPMNCTVHITPTSAEAWIGTQVMTRVRDAVAKAAGVPGRQGDRQAARARWWLRATAGTDMAYDAARIAKQMGGGPVKVVWTREGTSATTGIVPYTTRFSPRRWDGGRIVGWKHRSPVPRSLRAGCHQASRTAWMGTASTPQWTFRTTFPTIAWSFNREEPPGVNTAFWRGVGPNNNVFAIESFIDELARGAKQDPIAFRRAHLDKEPRLQAALDLVKQKSGWGTPLPARCGRGVCAQPSFGSYIATVVECAVSDAGEVELRRVTTAVDTGLAVNPDTIVAQLQGGHTFGLTAALYGQITLKNGRVEQSNFHDYQLLRMNQCRRSKCI